MAADDGLWLSVRPQRHPPSGEVSVELSVTLGALTRATVRRNGSLLRAGGDGRWTRLAVVRLPALAQEEAAVHPAANDAAAADPRRPRRVPRAVRRRRPRRPRQPPGRPAVTAGLSPRRAPRAAGAG